MSFLGFSSLYFIVVAACILAPITFWVYRFADIQLVARPGLGSRGAARERALGAGRFFSAIEPAVRFFSKRVEQLPIDGVREKCASKLIAAGAWLGLSADEFIALSVLGSLLGGAAGLIVVGLTGIGSWVAILSMLVGGFLPSMELDNAKSRRHLAINRGLPSAIDLATLCVGAGLDFPSALRHAAKQLPEGDFLKIEFQQILRELALGHTRKRALEAFAGRAKVPAIIDFVASVVQAEQKGTPLREVLRVQGRLLRMRRSVMAEEAAARAGVLMMLPLVMIFGCVFLLLLGPFIVNMLESGF